MHKAYTGMPQRYTGCTILKVTDSLHGCVPLELGSLNWVDLAISKCRYWM
jgi:hypothetical protein